MSDIAIDITREDRDGGGRYVARADGYPDAEMTFVRAGASQVIIDHTGVPDEMRGLGVGAKLVARAVADARAEGFKIIPLCPFAKAQFDRHPEWADVRKGG